MYKRGLVLRCKSFTLEWTGPDRIVQNSVTVGICTMCWDIGTTTLRCDRRSHSVVSNTPSSVTSASVITARRYHHDLLRHKAAQKIQIKYNGIQLKHRYKRRLCCRQVSVRPSVRKSVKGKGSSLDIAPLTILDSGALQPPSRKWQLSGIDCSTAAKASGYP